MVSSQNNVQKYCTKGHEQVFKNFLLLKIAIFKIEPFSTISGQNWGNMKLLKFKIMTIPCLLDSIHLQKDMDQFKILEKTWIDEEWNNNYSGDIVKINDLFISYEVIWFFEARFDSLRQAT